MDNIAKIIEESDNIAIIAHSDEDCDALCSSLAMLEMLKNKKYRSILLDNLNSSISKYDLQEQAAQQQEKDDKKNPATAGDNTSIMEDFDAKQNDGNQSGEKKYFFFEKDKVKNLGISIGVGNVFLRNGKDFQVETRGINSENFRCEINQAGTLIIENRRNIPGKRFFSHDSKSHWCPRFLITLPAETVLENLKINLGAGQLRSEKLNLTSARTMLDVSAGNFELSGIKSSVNSIRCGMGNVKINGIFTEYTEIDCGMGSVQIKMPVTSEKYAYEGKVAMGNIQFAKEKRSGFAQNYSGARSENHFSIKCGMGEVKVLFDEF